ncbi:Hypothetical protein SMAX5B_021627 [Scophthalmus maximus]|uniref:Uncharacterized protein n=1 Tax=Scophthalmus maximus TaxID=52904 RepID=A0A2U9B0W1_SCOMX|nr:Hypothetical protein SMAX5B_021627 [Scophthalmus maximus]
MATVEQRDGTQRLQRPMDEGIKPPVKFETSQSSNSFRPSDFKAHEPARNGDGNGTFGGSRREFTVMEESVEDLSRGPLGPKVRKTSLFAALVRTLPARP